MPISMIKLVGLRVLGRDHLSLAFSDGSAAEWSAAELIARDTVMTRPLTDADYFARVYRSRRACLAERAGAFGDQPAPPR